MLKRWTVVLLAAALGSLLYLSCPANHPPRVVSWSNTPTVLARNDTVHITCHATDDDGDPLTFNWSCYGGVLIDTSSIDSTVAWVAPSTAGSYMVLVTVLDNHGGAVTDTDEIPIAAPARVTLSIDSTATTPGAVKLRWTQNTDIDFLRYEVFSSETKGFSPSGNPDTMIINRTDTTWTKSGLLANHTYYFVVVVVDNSSNRSNSNEAATTVNSLPPTAITLYPIQYIEPTAVQLIWSENPDNDFSTYNVFYSTTPNFTPDTLTHCATITHRPDTIYTVVGLTPKTTYYFKVTVTNISSLADTSDQVNCSTTGLYQIGTNGHPLRLDLSMPGYAFLANQDGGMQIYSIINPENPFLYGALAEQDFCYHLFISATGDTQYAYVAYGSAGLFKVNVTNPATPLAVATLDTGWVHSVYKSGDYVYFGTYYNSVYYFAVTDAANLTTYSQIPMPDKLSEIVVYGNYAYVADHNGGLCIIDISNPTSPHEIASILATQNVNNSVNGLYISGATVYVAAGALGLVSVDISSPNQPRILQTLATPGSAQDVYVLGNYAYVADGIGGLIKVNIQSPAAMQTVTTYGVPGADIWDARISGISGNYAFMADHNGFFRILGF